MTKIVHVWVLNTETKTEVQPKNSALPRTKDQVQLDKHTYCTEF